MTVHLQTDTVTVHHGDSLDVLRTMPDASVDAVVTDPPYGLAEHSTRDLAAALAAWLAGDRAHVPDGRGFMGNQWDRFVPPPAVWDECLRVLKPGGHLLAFAGSRTADLMGISVRLAGFEVRDSLTWMYGSGFPKSHSVHKATLDAVRSRYAEAACDCLDPRNGRTARHDAGQGGGRPIRAGRGTGEVPPQAVTDPDLPFDPRASAGVVRELREDDAPQAAGPPQIGPLVLRPGVRGSGPEAPGLGDSAVWAGVEEPASGDPSTRQGVSVVREDAGAERDRAACSSPGAVPVRGDEPSGEPGGAVRPVSPHDRGGDGPRVGVDPCRSDPRRTVPDDLGGRVAAVARVCSWCGLPDPGWLESLRPLGTALKPASEPIIVARKPLAGTVAANVLAHGTGALNIAACRVPHASEADLAESLSKNPGRVDTVSSGVYGVDRPQQSVNASGRWPANVVYSHAAVWDDDAGDLVDACADGCADGCPVAVLDEQSGHSKSPPIGSVAVKVPRVGQISKGDERARVSPIGHGDSGGASRFFPTFRYQAKAPASERPKVDGVAHPTVKPVNLMRWLVRLVCPPGGTVLEPFAGSGTTVEACLLEGAGCIAVERGAEYLPLIGYRVARATQALTPEPAPPPASAPAAEGAPTGTDLVLF